MAFVVQAVREYRRDVKENKVEDRGKINVLVKPGLYQLAFNIVSTKEKLANNREEIVKFIRGTIPAGDYINQNRNESAGQLEKWLGLAEDDLKDFVHTTDFKVHLDVKQIKAWLAEEVAWVKSIKPDARVPESLDAYVDSSLLSEIDTNRVSNDE